MRARGSGSHAERAFMGLSVLLATCYHRSGVNVTPLDRAQSSKAYDKHIPPLLDSAQCAARR